MSKKVRIFAKEFKNNSVMKYNMSLDAAYAAEWQISDDDLMQSRFEVAVEMYDRLHASRTIDGVLRWMWGHCRIHWGYQVISCLAAFNVWPSLSEVMEFFEPEHEADGLARFEEIRFKAKAEYSLPPRVAGLEY